MLFQKCIILFYLLLQISLVLCLEPIALFGIDVPQLETNNINFNGENNVLGSIGTFNEKITKFGEIAGLDYFGKPTSDQYHVVGPGSASGAQNKLEYAPVTESTISKDLEQFIKEKLNKNVRVDEVPPEKNEIRETEQPAEEPEKKYQHNPWDELTSLLPECKDAKLRGYKGQFACCTVKSGDWMDPNIWSCHRTPTFLDAVFIRHFVRLSTVPNNIINVRALWLIDSLEEASKHSTDNGGILRAGVLDTNPCGATNWSKQANLGQVEIRAMSKVFYLLLNGNFLADLPEICAAFKAKPFNNEDDYFMENNIIIEIKKPKQPIPKKTTLSILKQSIENMNALSGDKSNPPDEGFAFIPLPPESFNLPRDDFVETEIEFDTEKETEQENLESENYEFDIDEEYDEFEYNEFEYGNNEDASLNESELNEIQLLELDMDKFSTYPTRNLQSTDNIRKPSNSSTLNLNGPTTLRVEARSGLLLFSNVSITLDGDLRNDGTFYIGESFLSSCMKKAQTMAQKELCRIPSLDPTGSMIAMQPVNLMWLQVGRGESAPHALKKPKVWYGSIQYSEDLPLAHRSTITFFGTTHITSILPGFSFSFKRLGFPPFPAPPLRSKPTQLVIQNPQKSSDLILYMDIFDDDGYINCCKPFYEEEVAEFSVSGANVIFGRYQSIFKSFGDFDRLDISEQIVIRASTISMEENFFATSPIIPPKDSIATSVQKPQKKAGMNKDIVYFQCTTMCFISNQSFKPKAPFKYVQVQRTSPKMSIIENLS